MDGGTGVTRRAFLQRLAAVSVPLGGVMPLGAAVPLGAVQDSLAGRGEVGTLREPGAAGRPRQPTIAGDFDAEIQAIEQRLACTCGCTLDIFTCRTTDFTCTYSPELHREVLALYNDGKSAQEILDAFVDKYGEQALMAPKPEGFNLAGYLLPGAAIAAAGAALFAIISRRRVTAAAADAKPQPDTEEPAATPEELERLRRALSEVED